MLWLQHNWEFIAETYELLDRINLLPTETRAYNGIQVDQRVARQAQQEPEGEMEGTETAAAAETP